MVLESNGVCLMGTEIERKFLVCDDSWEPQAHRGTIYRQGYLPCQQSASVRVRVAAEKGYLNIKSAAFSVRRKEFEYEIPLHDAEDLLDTLCQKPLIEKIRYLVDFGKHTWEVDVFEGENDGLVLAEVELKSPDEPFELPGWAGEEVSDDPRYYNPYLIERPYKTW